MDNYSIQKHPRRGLHSDDEGGERLQVAVVASDGGHLKPVADSKSAPDVSPINPNDELKELADYLG